MSTALTAQTVREAAAATLAVEAARAPRPNPDRPGYATWNGETGEANSRVICDPTQPVSWDDIITELGLDPADIEIVGTPEVRAWDAPNGERMRYYKARLRRRTPATEAESMPELARLVDRAKPPAKPKASDRPKTGVVVAFADAQVGKVDHRGGTPELIERVALTWGLLDEYVRKVRPDVALWADVGDVVEGFDSGGDPAFCNDLSIMRQVELAAAIEHAGVDVLRRRVPKVTVAGIGSNHCRWRAGKQNRGKPSDDWGLSILRQLRAEYARHKATQHIEFALPVEHAESVTVDVLGVKVGVVHGHQARRATDIGKWWANQVHGGGPLADADLLIAGHFHHWATYPSGRSIHTGREKRVYCAPTLDSGSSWFANIAGGDSDPGLLVLTITEGIGVTACRVLRPEGFQ